MEGVWGPVTEIIRVPISGIRNPATNRNQASMLKMRNPGINVPRPSLMAPTTRGDKKVPIPGMVISHPQARATFRGVIPGSSIGKVRSTGTYSQQPRPMTITEI
jgi:hypothetical protein